MVKDVHPADVFKDENPSITYIWKWLKNMLIEYMNIKVNIIRLRVEYN